MAPASPPQQFDVTPGSSLSRTVIPALPPHYLSRKHLFHLLDTAGASTTVVIAPLGYGKTSLTAEWARAQKRKVIWLTLTDRDSLADMSAIFIQATRNVLPGFGSWFEKEPGLRPVEIVKRWSNEILATGEDYVLVIDSLRERTKRDVDIASRLVEQFPQNVQFITIRQDSIETVYQTFAARGPLKVIGKADLIFSAEEVENIARVNQVALTADEVKGILQTTHGWPAAVSLMLSQVGNGKKAINFEKIVASESDPLRSLVRSAIEDLDEKTRSAITALSVLSEFDHEQAKIILNNGYSYDVINQLALDGTFFKQTGNPDQTFEFSHLVREVLLIDLRADQKRKVEIHKRLLNYHEERNEPYLALEHAFLSEAYEKVAELFPDAARVLQATGQGGTLIRWSVFAGDTSRLGLLKRATVELAGHMANQDLTAALSLISQMQFDAKGSELEGFIGQLTCAATAHIDFSMGRFADCDANIQRAIEPIDEVLQIGIDEQICLYRLSAMKAFIFDDTEKIEEVYSQAQALSISSKIPHNHLMLMAIQAMYLFQIGDYRKAYEAAVIANAQFSKLNYVGCFGPLDVLFVMARSLLEFARPQEAEEKFMLVRALAEKWGQWSWHFMADGFLARDLVLKGKAALALDSIKSARQRASEIEFIQELDGIIDLAEIFIRYQVKDYDRLGALLERAPKVRFTQQIKLSYDEKMGKKTVRDEIRKLPTRTPREKIWKHLADASEVIDQEQAAIYEMRKALDVGATVGAKETFLRQSDAMGNLILKIAGDNPTVYMEDLASAVVERFKNRSQFSQFGTALTKREIEVLRQLSTERTISAISANLHISINTMKTHLKNLYRKMEVENRKEAVEKAKAHFVL